MANHNNLRCFQTPLDGVRNSIHQTRQRRPDLARRAQNENVLSLVTLVRESINNLETVVGTKGISELDVFLPFTERSEPAFGFSETHLVAARLAIVRFPRNIYVLNLSLEDGELMRRPVRPRHFDYGAFEREPAFSEIVGTCQTRDLVAADLAGNMPSGKNVHFASRKPDQAQDGIPDALYFMSQCIAVAADTQRQG